MGKMCTIVQKAQIQNAVSPEAEKGMQMYFLKFYATSG